MEGRINGRRGRERPRTMWTDNTKERTKIYNDCIRVAQDRERWESHDRRPVDYIWHIMVNDGEMTTCCSASRTNQCFQNLKWNICCFVTGYPLRPYCCRLLLTPSLMLPISRYLTWKWLHISNIPRREYQLFAFLLPGLHTGRLVTVPYAQFSIDLNLNDDNVCREQPLLQHAPFCL